ncbi:MAG: acylphosphatase [Spirochaetota bacterium]
MACIDMRRSYRVKGRVQGVGFRQFTAARARELGLVGWVRNLPDGSVEAEAQGSESTLAELESHLRRGPGLARVDVLEIALLAESPDDAGFEILR